MGTQQVTTGSGGQVARSQKDIQSLLESDQFRRAVASALPKHITPDRFIRVALTAMMRTPKLRECTQESLFKCLLDLSMYGLEPDGRRAHLIPFKRSFKDDKGNWQKVMEVQLILDYKGISELVRRSGDVSYIHADVVYEFDEFDYGFGSGAFLKHKPNMEERGEKVKCFYSFVRLKDGSEDFIVMSRSDVDKIRKRSKSADDGPWVTDYDEMGKKTVFRRHSKWLPLSPEVRDAVEADDEVIDTRLAQTPDGDPAWLEIGSEKAAAQVAEAKIAQMEQERAAKGRLPGETPTDRDARIERQMAEQFEEAKKREAAPQKIYDDVDALPDPESLQPGSECLFQEGDVLKRLRVEADKDSGISAWRVAEEVSATPKSQPVTTEAPAAKRERPVFGRK